MVATLAGFFCFGKSSVCIAVKCNVKLCEINLTCKKAKQRHKHILYK